MNLIETAICVKECILAQKDYADVHERFLALKNRIN